MSISERECLSAILRQLNLHHLPRAQQDALMRGVGFEEDVTFAKSLFTDRVAALYKELDGQFQRLVARRGVAQMEKGSRLFLLAVFRRFHEEKMKVRADSDLLGMKLPPANNIEEVIAFQKRMYELFKHLIPQQSISVPFPAPLFYPAQPNFSPFAIYCAERGRSMMEPDFPSLPFIPFNHRLSADSLRRYYSHIERQPFFRANSFIQLEKGNPVWQQEEPLGGFTTFGDEDQMFKPNKRIKRENNVNFAPQNVVTVRRELEILVQSRNKSKDMAIEPSMSLQESLNHPPTSIKAQLRTNTADFQQKSQEREDQDGAQ